MTLKVFTVSAIDSREQVEAGGLTALETYRKSKTGSPVLVHPSLRNAFYAFGKPYRPRLSHRSRALRVDTAWLVVRRDFVTEWYRESRGSYIPTSGARARGATLSCVLCDWYQYTPQGGAACPIRKRRQASPFTGDLLWVGDLGGKTASENIATGPTHYAANGYL